MNYVKYFSKLECPYCKKMPEPSTDNLNLNYLFYTCKYNCQKYYYFVYSDNKYSFYMTLPDSFDIRIHFDLISKDSIQFKFIHNDLFQRRLLLDIDCIPNNLNYQDPDQLINQLKLLTAFK